VKQHTQDKKLNPDLIDQWLDIDEQRSVSLQALEDLNREKNELAAVGKEGGDIESIRTKGQELKEKQSHLESEFSTLDEQWTDLIGQIPNLHSPEMHVGNGEEDNKVVHQWGEIPQFDFEPKDHVEIGRDLDIIDIESAAIVSGARFNYL